MTVKSIKNLLLHEDKIRLQGTHYANQDYHITIAKEYLVLGLTFDTIKNESMCLVEHVSDFGHIVSSPLFMFEITENTTSKFWEMKIWDDRSITLFPKLLYEECFHDKHSDGILDVVQRFNSLYSDMKEEVLPRIFLNNDHPARAGCCS